MISGWSFSLYLSTDKKYSGPLSIYFCSRPNIGNEQMNKSWNNKKGKEEQQHNKDADFDASGRKLIFEIIRGTETVTYYCVL